MQTGNVAPHKISGHVPKAKRKGRAFELDASEIEKWFTHSPQLDTIGVTEKPKTPAELDVDTMAELYARGIQIHRLRFGKMASQSFEEEILKKGTASDKIAACVMLIAGDPIGNVSHLDALLELCDSNNHRAAELALEASRDIFANTLLIPSRSLLQFKDQPLSLLHKYLLKSNKIGTSDKKKNSNNKLKFDTESDNLLLYWYFEDQLKKKYKKYLEIVTKKLQVVLITATKAKCLFALRLLVRASPEEREFMLKSMILKLGDKEKAIGTRVMTQLLSLINPFSSEQYSNPYYTKGLDRLFIINEVAAILYNPKVAKETKKYASGFLSQIELTSKVDKLVAEKLISVYLQVCKALFSNFEIQDESFTRSILTGICKAFPISELPSSAFSEYIDSMFQVARKSHFNTSVEALRVIHVIVQRNDDAKLVSSFYTLLYGRMLDNAIRDHATKCGQFLSLLYLTIRSDTNTVRQKAFVKRLLQLCFNCSPGFTCAALILVRNLTMSIPELKSMFTQPEDQGEEADDEVFDDENDDDTSKSKPSAKLSANIKRYEPHISAPQISNADKTAFWDLLQLVEHFHPSASMFAKLILEDQRGVAFKGNPLEDFSVSRFLDKFIFKKAKSKKLLFNPVTGTYGAATKQHQTISMGEKEGSFSFMDPSIPASKIAVDEQFFHKYFKLSDKKKKRKESVHAQKKQNKLNETVNKKAPAKKSQTSKTVDGIASEQSGDAEEEDQSDGDSVYSYSQLEQVLNEEGRHNNDEAFDRLMLEYASDEEENKPKKDDEEAEDEENYSSKKEKNKKDKQNKKRFHGFDVTKGEFEMAAQPSQDEIAELQEEGEKETLKTARKEDTFISTASDSNKQKRNIKRKQGGSGKQPPAKRKK